MSQLVCRPNGAVADRASKPLISALVSTRNQEAHLRECLHGLLDQSIAERLEIIVIDQGSQQAEWAIVADLQRQHAKVAALRPAAGTPQGTALNMAASMASGRYLFVLQATDRLGREALEMLAAALDAAPDAMAAQGAQQESASGMAPHFMWRRELHEAVGGFEAATLADSIHDFLQRAAQRHRTLHLGQYAGLAPVPAEPQPAGEKPAAVAPLAAALTPTPAAQGAHLSAEEAYQTIRELLGSGSEQAAAEALQAHLASYPRHAVAHNDFAALNYRLGDVEASLHHYQEAVRLSPQESLFRKNLADFYFVEAGRTDDAIHLYLALLAEAPRDTETLLNLGVICEAVGQPQEAESFYQRALEIEPWNPTVRERITALRSGASAAVAAPAPVCQEPAARQESVAERYAKVQALVDAGAADEARAELERIVDDFPHCAVAHNDLAVLSYQAGEKNKALQHYEKAALLEPGNSVFQKNLADFYFVDGNNLDSAIAIYLEELRKAPRDVETLMSLGKICNFLKRPEEARSFLARAVELEPWNPEAREELSLVA